MTKKNGNHLNSMLISDTARDSAKAYQNENIQIRRKKEEHFFNRSLDYRDYIFSPEGYEGIVFALYFMMIPYLTGLSFLFLFIAEANYDYFLAFNLTSFFIIWAIGYEVCAALILGAVFLAWLKHLNGRWIKEKEQKPPSGNRYRY